MTPLEKASAVSRATAFAIGMERVTGVRPQVDIYDNYVEVWWPAERAAETISYLDRQIGGVIGRAIQGEPTSDDPPDVQIRFGQVILPWSLRYVIPILAAAFLAGRISKRGRRT